MRQQLSLSVALLSALLAAPAASRDFVEDLKELQPLIDNVLEPAKKLAYVNGVYAELDALSAKVGKRSSAEDARFYRLIRIAGQLEPGSDRLKDFSLAKAQELSKKGVRRSYDEQSDYETWLNVIERIDPTNGVVEGLLFADLDVGRGRDEACTRLDRLDMRPAGLAQKLLDHALANHFINAPCKRLFQKVAAPPARLPAAQPATITIEGAAGETE